VSTARRAADKFLCAQSRLYHWSQPQGNAGPEALCGYPAYIALEANGFALGNGGRSIDCTLLRSRLRATE